MNNKLTINTDGGSRGNPGPAAAAAVIQTPSGEVIKLSKYLGVMTNNQAEYEGVLLALKHILENLEKYQAVQELHFVLDSELVVRQLTGVYKIKHPSIQTLAKQVRTFLKESGKKATFDHVLREKNKDADFLLNQELDKIKN